MNRHVAWWIALFGGALLVAHEPAAPNPPTQQARAVPDSVQRFDRFDGVTTFRARDGRPIRVSVAVRTWGLDSHQRVSPFPETGFLVVELVGGEVTTTIGRETQRRAAGEFWTLPPGASMSVETGDDAAVLQTYAIR